MRDDTLLRELFERARGSVAHKNMRGSKRGCKPMAFTNEVEWKEGSGWKEANDGRQKMEWQEWTKRRLHNVATHRNRVRTRSPTRLVAAPRFHEYAAVVTHFREKGSCPAFDVAPMATVGCESMEKEQDRSARVKNSIVIPIVVPMSIGREDMAVRRNGGC